LSNNRGLVCLFATKGYATLTANNKGMRGNNRPQGYTVGPKSNPAPVVSKVVLVILHMAVWTENVLYVRGALDLGDGETLDMHVPQGMEQWYGPNVDLRFRKTQYGIKQNSPTDFWILLFATIRSLKCIRSYTDLCRSIKWTIRVMLSCSRVDDCFNTGSHVDLLQQKNEITAKVYCDDGNDFPQFVRFKIAHDNVKEILKFIQAMLLQSFTDALLLDMNCPNNLEYPSNYKLGMNQQWMETGESYCRSKKVKYHADSNLGFLMLETDWSANKIGSRIGVFPN
jgi:hypothetical protein